MVLTRSQYNDLDKEEPSFFDKKNRDGITPSAHIRSGSSSTVSSNDSNNPRRDSRQSLHHHSRHREKNLYISPQGSKRVSVTPTKSNHIDEDGNISENGGKNNYKKSNSVFSVSPELLGRGCRVIHRALTVEEELAMMDQQRLQARQARFKNLHRQLFSTSSKNSVYVPSKTEELLNSHLGRSGRPEREGATKALQQLRLLELGEDDDDILLRIGSHLPGEDRDGRGYLGTAGDPYRRGKQRRVDNKEEKVASSSYYYRLESNKLPDRNGDRNGGNRCNGHLNSIHHHKHKKHQSSRENIDTDSLVSSEIYTDEDSDTQMKSISSSSGTEKDTHAEISIDVKELSTNAKRQPINYYLEKILKGCEQNEERAKKMNKTREDGSKEWGGLTRRPCGRPLDIIGRETVKKAGGGERKNGTNDDDVENIADVVPIEVDKSISFEQIGGLPSHILTLREMVLIPLLYPKLLARLHIRPPRGVLFVGSPGTGKTLMACALASEGARVGGDCKITFFLRKGADVLSKWLGESERQLRLLFEEAQARQPSIIFFDEIDGLAPVRHSKQEQSHAALVSTLLALMDGLNDRGQVIVIGATNRPDTIDPALRRPGRFDRELRFPLPDYSARKQILSIHMNKQSVDTLELRHSIISDMAAETAGWSGADLGSLCTESALHALRRAVPQIYVSSEKLLVNPFKININMDDYRAALRQIGGSSMRRAAMNSNGGVHVNKHLITLLEMPIQLALDYLSHAWAPAAASIEHVFTENQVHRGTFSQVRQLAFTLTTQQALPLLALPRGLIMYVTGSLPSNGASTAPQVMDSLFLASEIAKLISIKLASMAVHVVHLPNIARGSSDDVGQRENRTGLETGSPCTEEFAGMGSQDLTSMGFIRDIFQRSRASTPSILVLYGMEEWLVRYAGGNDMAHFYYNLESLLSSFDVLVICPVGNYQGNIVPVLQQEGILPSNNSSFPVDITTPMGTSEHLRHVLVVPEPPLKQKTLFLRSIHHLYTQAQRAIAQHLTSIHSFTRGGAEEGVGSQRQLSPLNENNYKSGNNYINNNRNFSHETIENKKSGNNHNSCDENNGKSSLPLTNPSLRGNTSGFPLLCKVEPRGSVPISHSYTTRSPSSPSVVLDELPWPKLPLAPTSKNKGDRNGSHAKLTSQEIQALHDDWEYIEFKRRQLRYLLNSWMSPFMSQKRYNVLISVNLDLTPDHGDWKDWQRHISTSWRKKIGLGDIVDKIESDQYNCLSQFTTDIDALCENVKSFFGYSDTKYRPKVAELKQFILLNLHRVHKRLLYTCEKNKDTVEPDLPDEAEADTKEEGVDKQKQNDSNRSGGSRSTSDKDVSDSERGYRKKGNELCSVDGKPLVSKIKITTNRKRKRRRNCWGNEEHRKKKRATFSTYNNDSQSQQSRQSSLPLTTAASLAQVMEGVIDENSRSNQERIEEGKTEEVGQSEVLKGISFLCNDTHHQHDHQCMDNKNNNEKNDFLPPLRPISRKFMVSSGEVCSSESVIISKTEMLLELPSLKLSNPPPSLQTNNMSSNTEDTIGMVSSQSSPSTSTLFFSQPGSTDNKGNNALQHQHIQPLTITANSPLTAAPQEYESSAYKSPSDLYSVLSEEQITSILQDYLYHRVPSSSFVSSLETKRTFTSYANVVVSFRYLDALYKSCVTVCQAYKTRLVKGVYNTNNDGNNIDKSMEKEKMIGCEKISRECPAAQIIVNDTNTDNVVMRTKESLQKGSIVVLPSIESNGSCSHNLGAKTVSAGSSSHYEAGKPWCNFSRQQQVLEFPSFAAFLKEAANAVDPSFK